MARRRRKASVRRSNSSRDIRIGSSVRPSRISVRSRGVRRISVAASVRRRTLRSSRNNSSTIRIVRRSRVRLSNRIRRVGSTSRAVNISSRSRVRRSRRAISRVSIPIRANTRSSPRRASVLRHRRIAAETTTRDRVPRVLIRTTTTPRPRASSSVRHNSHRSIASSSRTSMSSRARSRAMLQPSHLRRVSSSPPLSSVRFRRSRCSRCNNPRR